MADSSTSVPPKFFNYPEPRNFDYPYKAPPKENNPVIRGIPLAIGASLVSAISPVATFLFNNAGFNSLRGLKEVDDIECRFDPTVIPFKSGEDKAENYTDASTLRKLSIEWKADTKFYSIRDYHEAFKSGKTTPTAVVNTLLPLISRDVTDRSPHSTAFLSTRSKLALAAAAASTARYAAGTSLGILDGVPIGVKDEVDVKGHPRSLGTAKSFGNGESETSWCVAKWEEAGAVIVGKTNMHEIGMDTTNLNSTHGTPLNPYNSNYYTGGSSGGSGYAVGAGLVPVALGCGKASFHHDHVQYNC
jgi:hypothetical protein